MTKILNFALKIKGVGREGGTCEVLRPCHPPKKKLERAPMRIRVSGSTSAAKSLSSSVSVILSWSEPNGVKWYE